MFLTGDSVGFDVLINELQVFNQKVKKNEWSRQ